MIRSVTLNTVIIKSFRCYSVEGCEGLLKFQNYSSLTDFRDHYVIRLQSRHALILCWIPDPHHLGWIQTRYKSVQVIQQRYQFKIIGNTKFNSFLVLTGTEYAYSHHQGIYGTATKTGMWTGSTRVLFSGTIKIKTASLHGTYSL